MAQADFQDWTELLQALERRLEGLAREGVRWLNLAGDPDLAALLAESRRRPLPPELQPATGAEFAPDTPRAAPPASGLPADAPPQPGAGEEPSPEAASSPAAPAKHPSEIGTLESLRFQYSECANCKLAPSRNRLVFGTGPQKPRLMFIGEGPGAEEDQQGLPFVGRAGALLTGLIAALGLTREDVYITNVVKCRPPGNRNPEPDEMAACRPILARQIELLQPHLIVTLGNVPLKAFNPKAGGITRERGRLFLHQGREVLPTFHPSYLLRNPAAISACWGDFRQAWARAYGDSEEA